jgi:hypothetical protein
MLPIAGGSLAFLPLPLTTGPQGRDRFVDEVDADGSPLFKEPRPDATLAPRVRRRE